MADWGLNEPVITALVARLAANLPVELAAIRATLTADEAAALPDPQQVLDFAPPPGYLAGGLPAVGITDAITAAKDDTGSSVTGRHEIGIVVYFADPDQRLLAWGLRRYQQAVCRVALAGRGLGSGSVDGAYATGLARILPGQTLQDEDDPRVFTSWSTVVIWAEREELG